jgi:hypothetical protein
VYRLIEEMPHAEFNDWLKFFEERPAGWRDDDRAFKQIQAWGTKAKPWEYFPRLYPIYHPSEEEEKTTNMKTFKGSFLFSKVLSAKGGEKLDVDSD